MKNKRYMKAPISEVIIGLNFKESILKHEDILNLYSLFKKEYKNTQVIPPLQDENLIEGDLRLELNNFAGVVLYRFRSVDKKWLLQVQQNKIYLNWVRLDSVDVGKYPGFSKICDKYYKLIDNISKNIRSIDFNKLKYYELTYHDRILWRDYINNLQDIDKIINIKIPEYLLESNEKNEIHFLFSHILKELNAYTSTTIRSISLEADKEILQVEKVVKIFTNKNFKDYFDKAHSIQVDFFEKLFKEEVKKSWL